MKREDYKKPWRVTYGPDRVMCQGFDTRDEAEAEADERNRKGLQWNLLYTFVAVPRPQREPSGTGVLR